MRAIYSYGVALIIVLGPIVLLVISLVVIGLLDIVQRWAARHG